MSEYEQQAEAAPSLLNHGVLEKCLEVVDQLSENFSIDGSKIRAMIQLMHEDSKSGNPAKFRMLYNVLTTQSQDDIVTFLEDQYMLREIERSNKEAHKNTVNEVTDIITNLVKKGCFDDSPEMGDHLSCIIAATMHLNYLTAKCRTPYTLPPIFTNILHLSKDDSKEEQLVSIIRKLIVDSKMSSEIQRYEKEVHQKLQTVNEDNCDKVLASLGTGVVSAMSVMSRLVPQANSFRGLIEGVNDFLLGKAFTSTSSMFAVSGVFLTGVTVYNIYKCITQQQTKQLTAKKLLEAVGAMSIGTIATYGAAAAFASISSPFLVTATIFGSVGFISSLVSGYAIGSLFDWFFSEGDATLLKAYETLYVSPDATLEEIKTAYRFQTRKYHPDTLGPNSSDTEKKDAKEMLLQVQDAFKYIITAKSRDKSFSGNVRSFFQNLFKSNEPTRPALPSSGA